MAVLNLGRKISNALWRLLWEVLEPLEGYMNSVRRDGLKRCAELARTGRGWSFL
jgi:hypothetical protein